MFRGVWGQGEAFRLSERQREVSGVKEAYVVVPSCLTPIKKKKAFTGPFHIRESLKKSVFHT